MRFEQRSIFLSASAAVYLATILVLSSAVQAAPKLRVGRTVATSFSYVPLDVGLSQGIFQKEGLEIDSVNFAGAAPMEQAMISHAIDIGLGASAMLGHLYKGSPETAVAITVNTMANLGMMIAYDSQLNTIDDLKGKKVGITSVGSLSDMLVRVLNDTKGWTEGDAAAAVAIGSNMSAMTAALKLHSVDAIVGDIGLVFEFEDAKEARLLAPVSSYVNNFPREVIYVVNELRKDNPDAIRRFVKAWFESVAFMKRHKAESVTIAGPIEELKPAYAGRMYDLAVSMYSDDGKFDKALLAQFAYSMAEMNLLPKEADLTPYYTEEFLPAAK